MTQWQPIWRVKIDGADYTDAILANLVITSGRTNIYEQAQAGYVSIQLIDLNQAAIPVNINSTISIEIQDSSATYVPIFGGSVVDVSLMVNNAGSVMFTQTYQILALGALARLPKILTEGILVKDHDGDQIWSILENILLASWNEVPVALTWATYDPTITWANAGNVGLGEIDRPGDYELAARTASTIDVYSLVAALATSGLGYIYEDAQGRISYADSTHRTTYVALNGLVDLSANKARANGLKITTRAGDVRNAITIKYKENQSQETSASDAASIALYGELAQEITTTIDKTVDAEYQADFYLSLRAYPRPVFDVISYELTNSELTDTERDTLLNVFMGLPLNVTDLPLNMNSGAFAGFVEGWTFQASYNQLAITLNLSPLAFSLQAMTWAQVPVIETWSSVSPTLDWQSATIVI